MDRFKNKKLTTAYNIAVFSTLPMVDQRFPAGGAPTPQGAPTYDFAKFSQTLHEI